VAARKAESAADREARAREALLAGFESICPGIIGNRFVPHWPTPPQQLFLGLHLRSDAGVGVFEALYGGAAGGGKSDALLIAGAQDVHDPSFAGLVVRRTYSDLAKPGAIMDRALSWWVPLGAHWDGSQHCMRFPSGAKIQFSYMQNKSDHLNHKSAEYQATLWDELTELELESQYSFVGHSRVRRRAGSRTPLRTLSATNPGGPGHAWVKKRFIGDPHAGVLPILPGRYIPARIRDNPHVDQESYIAGLMHLHPTVREQMLNGDWRARDPGDYFRAEWFGGLLDPATDTWPSADCIRIRWWDLAASEKPDAARTAGVRMARHARGVRAIEHCRAFRATPGKRDDLIVQTAKADGYGVIVGLEIEGGSGGPAQFEALSKRLRAEGFRVVGARPRVGGPELTDREKATMIRTPGATTGKAGRADPVASCLERGYQRRGECANTGGPWWGLDIGAGVADQRDGLRLFSGPWTQDYLDEVEGFPDGDLVDVVDATSGAWAWLEAHSAGGMMPPTVDRKPPALAEPHGVHPDQRPEGGSEKTRAGRWRS
jgi:phage terminase large subunit-like protein